MTPLPRPLGVVNGITSVTVATPDEMVAVLTGIVTKKGDPEDGVMVKTKPFVALSEPEDGDTVTVKTPPGWPVGELAGPLESGTVTMKGDPDDGVTVKTKPLAVVSDLVDGGTVTVKTPPDWPVGELAGPLDPRTVTKRGEPETGVTVKTNGLGDSDAGAVMGIPG